MQFLCKIRIWNLPRLFNKFLFSCHCKIWFPCFSNPVVIVKMRLLSVSFLDCLGFGMSGHPVFFHWPSSLHNKRFFFAFLMPKMPITIKWTVNCRTIFSMARDLVGHPETATSLDLAADRDQWSKITRIIAHKMNRRINSGKGFISSSDVPWSEWSRIAYPDPYHPKGTHPFLEYLTFAWLFHSNFLPDMTELC